MRDAELMSLGVESDSGTYDNAEIFFEIDLTNPIPTKGYLEIDYSNQDNGLTVSIDLTIAKFRCLDQVCSCEDDSPCVSSSDKMETRNDTSGKPAAVRIKNIFSDNSIDAKSENEEKVGFTLSGWTIPKQDVDVTLRFDVTTGWIESAASDGGSA